MLEENNSPAVGCKKANSRRQRVIQGGEKEGCACEPKHGKVPSERKEGRLGKGQKLDAALRGVNLQINTHPPHPLLPKLLPRSCASMDYPKRTYLICSEREEFSKFLSILHRNESSSRYLLRKREQTLLVAIK